MVGVGVPDDPMWTAQGNGSAVFNRLYRCYRIICEKIIDFSVLGFVPFIENL